MKINFTQQKYNEIANGIFTDFEKLIRRRKDNFDTGKLNDLIRQNKYWIEFCQEDELDYSQFESNMGMIQNWMIGKRKQMGLPV